MSDDEMYWPNEYPWSRRPAPRKPARAPVIFRVILMLLWVVFISGIIFAALAIIPDVKAQDQDTLRDGNTNYLIPVDVKTTETGELWDQSLRLSEITRKPKTEAGNATHFVVFDACRNTLKPGLASGCAGKRLRAREPGERHAYRVLDRRGRTRI
jgi:hypothetical protein